MSSDELISSDNTRCSGSNSKTMYFQGPPRPGFSPGPSHPGSGPPMTGPPRMGMPGPHGGMPPHPYGGKSIDDLQI